MVRHRWLPLLLLLIGLLLFACDRGAADPPAPTQPPSGPPRAFAMGLSSLPPELTEESYTEAFELAASAGEVILIQRSPPWNELLSGEISEQTVRATERERELADDLGLDLFIAIDPIDVSESGSQLADLPADLRGAGFANEEIRGAFLDYARFVAQNYRPTYLALGVEVNSYQQQHPEDFERFVLLYHEAYDAVKEIVPDALVFPTFQLEELQGLLPVDDPLRPQWFLLPRFEPRLDLLAVSSFPTLAFDSAAGVPESYYRQLDGFTDHPVALTGIGYSSTGAAGASDARAEAEQAAFLERTLQDAEELSMPLVVWFVGQDPGFTGEPPYDFLQHLGLKRRDGSAKEAWGVWSTAARRPFEPPASAAAPSE